MPKLAEFKVSFNLPAVHAQTDYLRGLVNNGIVAATQAGAEVLYKEVKARAQGFADTGNLASAIYQWRNKDEQRPGHAQYKISWRKGTGKAAIKTRQDKAEGAGLSIAAHGILVEYGWLQRYASYVGSDGQWYTLKKKGVGKVPKYKGPRSGMQAFYDKYYELRKGGPIQHAPRSFLRAGFEAAQAKALEASRIEMANQINKGML